MYPKLKKKRPLRSVLFGRLASASHALLTPTCVWAGQDERLHGAVEGHVVPHGRLAPQQQDGVSRVDELDRALVHHLYALFSRRQGCDGRVGGKGNVRLHSCVVAGPLTNACP